MLYAGNSLAQPVEQPPYAGSWPDPAFDSAPPAHLRRPSFTRHPDPDPDPLRKTQPD
jgi:hypothetical protein